MGGPNFKIFWKQLKIVNISAPTNDEAFGFMFYVKLQNSSNQKQNGVTFTSDGISISVIDENMNFYASGKSSLSHLPRGTYNQISVDKQTVDRTNEWKFYQTRQCTLIEDECNWMRCQMNVVRTGNTSFELKGTVDLISSDCSFVKGLVWFISRCFNFKGTYAVDLLLELTLYAVYTGFKRNSSGVQETYTQRSLFAINSQRFEGYSCKSSSAIFAWRVTWN